MNQLYKYPRLFKSLNHRIIFNNNEDYSSTIPHLPTPPLVLSYLPSSMLQLHHHWYLHCLPSWLYPQPINIYMLHGQQLPTISMCVL